MLIAGIRNKKWDKAILLPALVFFVQTLPWFANRLRMRILAPVMLLYVLYTLTSPPKKTSTGGERKAAIKMLASCFLFFLVYLITHSRYYEYFINPWFVSTTFGLFYMWVFVRLAMENKVLEIKVLTVLALSTLVLGGYMGGTYLGNETTQNIIRTMTGGGGSDWELRDAVNAGVGTYGTVYSAGLLAPPLFYAGICSPWRWRIAFWSSGIVLLLYAYRAGFSILMAVVIFGLLSYGVSFIIKKYQPYKIVMICIIAFILAVTMFPKMASFVASPLVYLAEVAKNDNYKMRLISIANSIAGSDDDYAIYRTSLMWKSWRVFRAHPLVGASHEMGLIGGHSFFFDHLAIGGLWGFIPYPFFIFYYSRYLRRVVYPLSQNAEVLISTYFYMYLLCTFLNPLDSATIWACMFMILPCVSLFFKDSKLNPVNGWCPSPRGAVVETHDGMLRDGYGPYGTGM